jgi:SAM-dependent methyltransferase
VKHRTGNGIVSAGAGRVRGFVWETLYRLVAPAWWDHKMPRVCAAWADAADDHEILSGIFRRYRITTVLDIGCGAGRLFPLYAARGIAAVGVDISARALAIARTRTADIPTIRASLVSVRPGVLPCVDLVISNRVLQHIPRRYIERATATIARAADLVYVNEVSADDERREAAYLVPHDYARLFGAHGFRQYEQGAIGKHRWALFGRLSAAPVAGNAP